jgi:hypothetical protein
MRYALRNWKRLVWVIYDRRNNSGFEERIINDNIKNSW